MDSDIIAAQRQVDGVEPRALSQVVVKCKCQSLEEPLQVVHSPTLGNKKCTFYYIKHYTDQSRLCLIFLCHEYPLNEDSKCVSCFLVRQFNAEISDFKNGKKGKIPKSFGATSESPEVTDDGLVVSETAS